MTYTFVPLLLFATFPASSTAQVFNWPPPPPPQSVAWQKPVVPWTQGTWQKVATQPPATAEHAASTPAALTDAPSRVNVAPQIIFDLGTVYEDDADRTGTNGKDGKDVKGGKVPKVGKEAKGQVVATDERGKSKGTKVVYAVVQRSEPYSTIMVNADPGVTEAQYNGYSANTQRRIMANAAAAFVQATGMSLNQIALVEIVYADQKAGTSQEQMVFLFILKTAVGQQVVIDAAAALQVAIAAGSAASISTGTVGSFILLSGVNRVHVTSPNVGKLTLNHEQGASQNTAALERGNANMFWYFGCTVALMVGSVLIKKRYAAEEQEPGSGSRLIKEMEPYNPELPQEPASVLSPPRGKLIYI